MKRVKINKKRPGLSHLKRCCCKFSILEELHETTKRLVKYLDDNIKSITKELSRAAPIEFALTKEQFSRLSDAEIDQIMNLAGALMASRDQCYKIFTLMDASTVY